MAAAVYTADRGIERYFLDVFGNKEYMLNNNKEIIAKFVSIFDISTDMRNLVLKQPIQDRFTLIDMDENCKYVVQRNLTRVGPRILCSSRVLPDSNDTDTTVDSDSTLAMSSDDDDMDI